MALLGGCSAADRGDAAAKEKIASQPALGLMTTLPILWAEGDDFGAMLSADAQSHWAFDVLGRSHDVIAVDLLTPEALASLDLLVLAQPRMLSAPENVALDNWVREGGHALIFADPLLTGHSEYGIGDKRRPQDVVLLDTILARWGLILGSATPRTETAFVSLGGGSLPLEAEGAFTRAEPADGAQADCRDRLGAVLMICSIGQGRAVLLADAAVLESHETPGLPVIAALQELLAMAGDGASVDTAQKRGTTGE